MVAVVVVAVVAVIWVDIYEQFSPTLQCDASVQSNSPAGAMTMSSRLDIRRRLRRTIPLEIPGADKSCKGAANSIPVSSVNADTAAAVVVAVVAAVDAAVDDVR
jgi:hypothetical protein